MILFLRVLSIFMLVAAILLFIFHFLFDLNAFWFSIPLAIGIIANLIGSILYLKRKKEK